MRFFETTEKDKEGVEKVVLFVEIKADAFSSHVRKATDEEIKKYEGRIAKHLGKAPVAAEVADEKPKKKSKKG